MLITRATALLLVLPRTRELVKASNGHGQRAAAVSFTVASGGGLDSVYFPVGRKNRTCYTAMKLLSTLVLGLAAAAASAIKVGDKFPTGLTLDYGFDPVEKIDLSARISKKNVLVVGLPGAFTPT